MKINAYWPPLLQELQDFEKLAAAEQPEFDSFNDAVRQAPSDFFLATLTETGAARWEKILKITPGAGDTLAERRSRIMVQFSDQLPYTYRGMVQYLQAVNPDFTATVLFDQYIVKVGMTTEHIGAKAALETALRDMVPANMAIHFGTRYPMQIFAGAALGSNFAHIKTERGV